IAFWICHTEVAILTFFGILPFLMTNDHYRLPIDRSHATNNSFVVTYSAVAMQCDEIFAYHLNIIESLRTFRMTGHLYFLPTGHIGIYLYFCLFQFFF